MGRSYNPGMMLAELQDQCALGQEQLMHMDYLAAQHTLAEAEAVAWHERDFDTLARLYMPLQEARRQRRQRCGEGMVCLDLLAESAHDEMLGRHIVENYAQGQLLVAGWGTVQPALEVRRLAEEYDLYLETFLAAVYPLTGGERAIVVVPLGDGELPAAEERSLEELQKLLPSDALLLDAAQLPAGSQRGTAQTCATVMALWERLHTPLLARADAQTDPVLRIEGYRTTIAADYACELAHQKLSDVAKTLARAKWAGK